MALISTPVAAGDDTNAAQYNNLRQDLINSIIWDFVATARLPGAATDLFNGNVTTFDLYRITIGANASGVSLTLKIRFNGDSANNYDTQTAEFSGSSGVFARNTADSGVQLHQPGSILSGEEGTIEIIVSKPIATKRGLVISNASIMEGGLIKRKSNAGVWKNTADKITNIRVFATLANRVGADSVILIEGRNIT